MIASVASRVGVLRRYMLTTATADWTLYETIGGLKPDANRGLTCQEGRVLDTSAASHAMQTS